MRITRERTTGQLLGAQIVGHRGAQVAKRIDIPSVALFAGMSVEDLNDLDLSCARHRSEAPGTLFRRRRRRGYARFVRTAVEERITLPIGLLLFLLGVLSTNRCTAFAGLTRGHMIVLRLNNPSRGSCVAGGMRRFVSRHMHASLAIALANPHGRCRAPAHGRGRGPARENAALRAHRRATRPHRRGRSDAGPLAMGRERGAQPEGGPHHPSPRRLARPSARGQAASLDGRAELQRVRGGSGSVSPRGPGLPPGRQLPGGERELGGPPEPGRPRSRIRVDSHRPRGDRALSHPALLSDAGSGRPSGRGKPERRPSGRR
jgi:hypothetical protein